MRVISKFHKGKTVVVEKECWNDAIAECDYIILSEDVENIKSITIKHN